MLVKIIASRDHNTEYPILMKAPVSRALTQSDVFEVISHDPDMQCIHVRHVHEHFHTILFDGEHEPVQSGIASVTA